VSSAITTSAPTGWAQIARRIRVPLGFLFAVFYFWMAKPTWTSLGIGLCVAIPGLLIRALASGHVKKNEELTTSGPYAYTRNPLYLGSFILALGFAVAARSVWVGIVMVLFIAAIYFPVILSEEAFLRSQFAEFDDYARRVPRLIPYRIPRPEARSPEDSFSWVLYQKHREYNAVLGILGMLAALIAKMWLINR
jgi:protein-S-isoprenylcysteine O-methyltransferase Ste14